MKTWDQAQVRKFLEATVESPLGAIWYVAVVTGLRQGEILALTWERVDLDRGTISVRRGMISVEHGREFGPTKSQAGQRQVALPVPCVAILRAHRVRQVAQRLAAGPAWHDQGLVFPRYDGNVYPPSTLRKRWVETI
jgi:integrase